MTEHDILKIAKKAKKGDEEAFTLLINNFKYDFFRIAKSRLLNDEDAIDAVQETIISIYLNLDKLKNVHKFKVWAMKILINHCNTVYSKNRNRNDLQYETVNISDNTNIEYEIEVNEKVNNAFTSLTTEERTIISLFYIEEYKSKDIAKLLNINTNTLRTKLFRAREKMKKIINLNEKESL